MRSQGASFEKASFPMYSVVSCTCFNKYLFLLLHGWIPSGQTCIHQIQQKNPLQNHILQLVVMSLELSSGTVPQSLTFMILKPLKVTG